MNYNMDVSVPICKDARAFFKFRLLLIGIQTNQTSMLHSSVHIYLV